jgi:hypothetical protein
VVFLLSALSQLEERLEFVAACSGFVDYYQVLVKKEAEKKVKRKGKRVRKKKERRGLCFFLISSIDQIDPDYSTAGRRTFSNLSLTRSCLLLVLREI